MTQQSRDGSGRGADTPAWMPPQPRPQAADPFATGEVARLPAPPAPMQRPASDAAPAASDTDEMQDLLRKIAAQIAEAEKRQGVALDGMRTRLNDLAGQTEATKEQAPQTLQPGLTAIEKRISEMAMTVQAVSRDIKAAAPAAAGAPQQVVSPQSASGLAADAVQAVAPAEGSAAPKMHVRGFGRGQVRGSNDVVAADRQASPINSDAVGQPPALSSALRATAYAGLPAARAIESGASTLPSDATGHWDQESADALAKIFADEEAEVAHDGPKAQLPALMSAQSAAAQAAPKTALQPAPKPAPQPAVAQPAARRSSAAPALPAPASIAQAPQTFTPAAPLPTGVGAEVPARPLPAPVARPAASPPAAALPVSPMTASALPTGAASAPVPAPKTAAQSRPSLPAPASAPAVAASISGPDRDWLNSRFADIAGQLTRSLQESRPDRAFSAIGQRFDKLEASLATVVTAVQSRAPQSDGRAALQSLETHVTALKSQVDATVSRLEGLDGIKGELGELAQRLAILERLEKAQAATDGQVADTRGDLGKLARLIEDNHRSQTALTARAAAPAVADPRIDRLHQMLESQLVERRDGETATVAVLQAIQGSIDQLTGRIHQFEETVASVVMGGIDPGAEQAPAPGHPVRPVPMAAHMSAHMAAPMAVAGLPESHAHLAPSEAFELEERTQFARRGAPAKAPVHHDEIAAPAPERAPKRAVAEAPAPPAEAAIPRTRRGIGAILAGGMPQTAEQPDVTAKAPGARPEPRPGTRPEPRPEPREDMIQVARRSTGAAGKADVLADDSEPDVDIETIASRLPGQKRPKSKIARGGFFTFEKAGARPVYVVGLVALLAAGAGMLYGSMAERPQQPMPVMPGRMDKPALPPGKLGALQEKKPSDLLPNVELGQRSESSGTAEATDMRAADSKEAALSGLERGNDGDATALLTGSSPAPATTPAAPQAGDTGNLTTGILIDSGAPMPSAQDLQRYSQEQRMARISSHLGDKAVQKTESDHATPVRLTPDARRPDVNAASAQIAPIVPGPSAANNASGLPPALIGPTSLRVAAAKGDPSAEFEVASRFAQGKGVPRDFAAAAEWYQRAASKGSAPAQYRLGGLFERGIGVPADGTRARAWYKRAAEQGHTKAMHNLAVMLTQRDAGEPDYATASTWFTRAAGYGLPDSQFNLGILHENGMGVARSATEAYKWYALASEKGDPEAAKRRTAIAAKLSPADLDAARQLVARWRPQPADVGANDPLMAGQAWRNRNGDPSGADSAPASGHVGSDLARGAALAPSARAPRQEAPRQEAEIIDLTEAAIEAQQKKENIAQRAAIDAETAKRPKAIADAETADGGGIVNRKRRVAKAQSPADVEKMLAQYGYDTKALKKARPGGEPGDPSSATAAVE